MLTMILKPGVAIIISDIVNITAFYSKEITSDKEVHPTQIKVSIHQENITSLKCLCT